jgi:hypothetical protein
MAPSMKAEDIKNSFSPAPISLNKSTSDPAGNPPPIKESSEVTPVGIVFIGGIFSFIYLSHFKINSSGQG